MANEKRLIDGNALFEFLKEQREKETGAYSKGRNNGINVAIGAIRNEQICPTVDAVEVVHARWKPRPHHKFNSEGRLIKYCDFYYCSECGTERPIIPPYNYCPNCGAKMDGGNEDG